MLAFDKNNLCGNYYITHENSWSGMCFLQLHKLDVDLDKGYICKVPVIEKSSYKKPRIFFESSNISVMHGSKRGIQASHGNRVSEYNYYFSYWLGKRFAKYVKRTDKKIIAIKTMKEASCKHNRHQGICNDEFQRGFNDVFDNYNLNSFIVQNWIIDCNYKGQNARWDNALIFSDLYLSCHERNMDFDISKKAHSIIDDMAKIDMLEKQKKIITK